MASIAAIYTAAYIHWNVRPEIFQLGPLTVRWYGVFFAFAFCNGFLIFRWIFRVECKDEHDLDSLLSYMIAGTLIGARVGHCLFYDPTHYLSHPLEILQVWKGGLASHGGATGILIALYLYARHRPDQPYLWLLDRTAIAAALGSGCIRLGNLFNSEILGLPATVPWAFVFERVDTVPRHPVQLYEAVCYVLIFLVLLTAYLRLRACTPRGLLLGVFLISVFTFRFFIEFLKQPQETYDLPGPLTVGQWLSLPFIIVGALLLWRMKKAGGSEDADTSGSNCLRHL